VLDAIWHWPEAFADFANEKGDLRPAAPSRRQPAQGEFRFNNPRTWLHGEKLSPKH